MTWFRPDLTRFDAWRSEVFKQINTQQRCLIKQMKQIKVAQGSGPTFLVHFLVSSQLPFDPRPHLATLWDLGFPIRPRFRWSQRRWSEPQTQCSSSSLDEGKQSMNQCNKLHKTRRLLVAELTQTTRRIYTAAAGEQWRLCLGSPREAKRVRLVRAFGISVHFQCKWLSVAGPRIDHTLSVIERAASLSRNVAEEREPFVAFFPPFLFFFELLPARSRVFAHRCLFSGIFVCIEDWDE